MRLSICSHILFVGKTVARLLAGFHIPPSQEVVMVEEKDTEGW